MKLQTNGKNIMTHANRISNKSQLTECLKYVVGGLLFSACTFFVGNVTGCTDLVLKQADQDIRTSTSIPRDTYYKEQGEYASKNLAKWRAERGAK